jgi:hypothetical protein
LNNDKLFEKTPNRYYDFLAKLADETLTKNGEKGLAEGFVDVMKVQSGHETKEFPVAPLRYCSE